MKCLRPRKRWRIALGVLLIPPACWAAALALVPTGCARLKIVEGLARASGHKVSLGGVRLGMFGGVYFNNLTLGAPDSGADPWLRAEEVSLNLSVMQLVRGRVEPTEIDLRGVVLRVLRRRDGSVELSDLFRTEGTARPRDHGADDREPAVIQMRVHDASVLLVDEPTGTRLELAGVEGHGAWHGGVASVNDLRGRVNGGTFQFAAQVDPGSGTEPRFEGQIRLADVALRPGMNALEYLVPVLTGAPDGADGRLALDFYLRVQGATREKLARSAVGHGRISLDPIALDGSSLVAGLGRLVGLPSKGRVGAVRAGLNVKDGKVLSDDLTLDVARLPVVLSGWTDFDGRVDYRLRTEGITGKLSGKAREVLSDLSIKLDDLAEVRVRGTVDRLDVTTEGLGARGTEGAPVAPLDDRERLREIGRRLRDRLVR